jgi:hypothetical protein
MYNSSKQVLSKIAKMLNFADANPIQAKTADGKIFQSTNFDVNDDVFEVGADGKLTPAEDGEYTITFTTPEGEDSTQVIDIDGGKIAKISTPSEEADEENGAPEESDEEMDDATPPAAPEVTMGKDFVEAPKGSSSKQPAKSLPETTNEDEANKVKDEGDSNDPVISLSYRISELESQVKEALAKIGELTDNKLIAHPEAQTTNKEDDIKLEEANVAKLDGAPVEMSVNLSAMRANNDKREGNYQSAFLSKLYK